MSTSEDNNIDFEKIYSSSSEDFAKREEERATVNEQIQNIVNMVATAESDLKGLSVFGATEQLHLAKAKVELINVLKTLEDSANTRLENNFRAGKKFIDSRKK